MIRVMSLPALLQNGGGGGQSGGGGGRGEGHGGGKGGGGEGLTQEQGLLLEEEMRARVPPEIKNHDLQKFSKVSKQRRG